MTLKVNACEFTGTPSVFISSNTGSFESCPGTTLTLSTFNDPSYSYQWSKDGNAITGATNASIIISTSGNYSITASNPHGCVSSAGPVPVSFECPQPVNLTASNITNSSAVLTFTGTDCAELYRIRYHDINGGAWIYFDVTGTTTSLNNLLQQTTYEVEAETFCNESLTDSSRFTDPILITTGSGCPCSYHLGVSLVSFSKAMLTWTPSAGALRLQDQLSHSWNLCLVC
jgi:hypothetical protein